MRTIRGLLALALVVVVAVALPATVLAQSAGDEQYTDPFQGQNDSGGNGGGGGGGNGSSGSGTTQGGGDVTSGGSEDSGTTGSTTTAPSTESATPDATGAGSGSATLPVTGGPATMLAAIGAAFLLSGLALRRRA